MIESAPIPGLTDLPDGLVAILFTLAWCANATAAAVCRPGWRGSLIAAELAAAGFLSRAAGWQFDSALCWLFANQATSLLAGFGLTSALQRRLSPTLRLGARRFWYLAWPLLLLVVPFNLIVALFRSGLSHL